MIGEEEAAPGAGALRGEIGPSREGKDGPELWGETIDPSRLSRQELLRADSRASATAIPARKALFVPHTNGSKAGDCSRSHTDAPGLERHRQTSVSSQLQALECTRLRRWICAEDMALSTFWTQKPAGKVTAKPNSLGKQSKAPLYNS